jgi:hypothetical protein
MIICLIVAASYTWFSALEYLLGLSAHSELYYFLWKPSAKVCFLTASEYTYYEEFLKENPKVTVKCFVRKPIPIAELAKLVKQQLS